MSYLSQKTDYYSILEIPKNVSQECIAEAYRHLSIKYHPKIVSKEYSADSEYRFQNLCEAY
jgi:DnaJ-class molecular chaperone